MAAVFKWLESYSNLLPRHDRGREHLATEPVNNLFARRLIGLKNL